MTLDGPRLPAAAGKADSLVIFVHGYGANGDDLIGLAPFWQRALPNTAFAAPNAPQPCDGNPMGYQWFPITKLDPAETWKGVQDAASHLDGFITQELERAGLDESRLVLVGFSQGTMMSLHCGLRRATPPAAILGYSGALAGSDHLDQAIAKPPIFLIHGDQDPMIPVDAMFKAASALSQGGFGVQWHVSPGVGHSIGEDGLAIGGKFVTDALAGRLQAS